MPALVVWRLGSRDLRRRPAAAALLLVALTTVTGALTLALTVVAVTERPWERTFEATRGAHVVVDADESRAADLAPIAADPRVVAAAGPFPGLVFDAVGVGPMAARLYLIGRDTNPSTVDRPLVTDGSWVRPGALVLERSFARAYHLRPGDTVRLAGRDFPVAGIAVTTGWYPYRTELPGLAWTTQADAASLGPQARERRSTMALRLRDRDAAVAFALRHGVPRAEGPLVQPWPVNRDATTADLRIVRTLLLTAALAVALLTVASVAVLVVGRLAAESRRVGLLKAAGATPALAATVLLAEHAALALAATAAGLVLGSRVAPLIAPPAPNVVGAGDVPLSAGTAAAVGLTALAIVCLATVPPAIRGARTGTVRALTGPTRPATRTPRLLRLSAGLPRPVMLGVRFAARRPGRALLATASLAVTVTMVVAAMTLESTFAAQDARLADAPAAAALRDQLRAIAYPFLAALLVLAAVNAIMVAWTAVQDATVPTALVRALGATPRQAAAGLAVAQLVPALVAAIVGVPAGVAVFRLGYAVAGGVAAEVVQPSVPALLAVVPASVLVAAALTAAPARRGARRPIAPELSHD